MIKIKLPFWLNRKNSEINKIRSLFEKWWQLSWEYMLFLLKFTDEETCGENILNLIAYQRDITRIKNEPIELFRKRVKYAFINAKDAGSTKGFQNIFERLGIGKLETRERIAGQDFDIVHLKLTDSQLAENEQLIYEIIRQYGRTCRRYAFLTENELEIYLFHGEFGHDFYCDELKIN